MTTPGGAIELAAVWVPLMPEASGMAKGVNKVAADAEKRFGRAGKIMGADMAKNFDSSAGRSFSATLRDVEKQTNAVAKARKADADAAGRLRIAEAGLHDLGKKATATAKQRATAEESVARAQRARELSAEQLTQAEKTLQRAQRDAASTPRMPMGSQMADQGESAGDDFVAGFGGVVARLGTRAGPIGAAILAAGAVALAGGVVLGRQVMAGLESEMARDLIGAKMGADPATMRRVGDAAGGAYRAGFGDSVEANMEAVRSAIESGLIPRDAPTGVMQSTITDLQTVSAILGEDIPQVARGAGQMIKTGMVASVKEAADVLVWGQQNGLNVNGDLIDSVNEYSTQWRKLGFDARTALAYVSQMVKGGARDTDVASDALKEFSIRVVDGSDTTRGAMESIGLDADVMAQKFAEGGPTAKAAFDQVVAAVSAIEDPVKRSQVQVGLFGTQAEDLGAALDAINPAGVTAEVEAMAGATSRAGDQMADNAASSIESARRAWETGVDRMQTGMGNAFGPMLNQAAEAFQAHTPEIIGLFTNVAAAAIDAADGVGAFASGSVRVLGWMVEGFNSNFTPMISGVSSFLDMLSKALNVIPGMGEEARSLESASRSWRAVVSNLQSAPGTLDGIADGIDDLRAGLPGAADDLRQVGAQAADAERFTRSLGDAAAELSLVDGKVVISDNTPSVLANIDQTQYAITHLEDGTVALIPKTEQAAAQMDAWRRQQSGEPMLVPVEFVNAAGQRQLQVPLAPGEAVRVPSGAERRGWVPGPPPRARGGIYDVYDSVASFAGGKLPTQAMLQRPVMGAGLVQWAEPSTHGEAFIPLAPSNRQRSLKIWSETGRRLGVMGFEQGGIRGLENAVSSLLGAPYQRGGHSPSGTDCSGAMSWLTNAALGMPQNSRMATDNAGEWLTARGFVMGAGPSGTFRVGWKNGGPGGGHMAGTLPDGRNVESGGSVGSFAVGGPTGADAFPLQAYLPMEALYPDGYPSGSGGTSPLGYGSAGGSGSSGYGSASERASAVADAQDRAATAEGNVREKEAKLADAKASDRIAAENDLAEAERDRDKARAELTEAQNRPVGSDTGSGTGNGPDGKGFGSDMLAGALEVLGFDGDTFSDPTQWGIWKTGTGLANFFGGMLKNWNGDGAARNPMGAISNPTRREHGQGGSPGPGNFGNVGDGGLGDFQFGSGGGGGIDALRAVLPDVGDILANSQQPAPSLFGSTTTTTSTTHNQNSHNSTGQAFYGPVTIQQPVQQKPPERMNTRSTGLPK